MLATSIEEPFDNKDWLFEIKWDGYRVIAEIDKEKVFLWSRNSKLLNKKFSIIADSLAKLNQDIILDGEVVVLNNDGLPVFNWLQNYPAENRGVLVYYVFDLLSFRRKNLEDLPLTERKSLLEKIIPPSLPHIKISQHINKTGVEFFLKAKEMGFEGIVGKEKSSKYLPGKRTSKWLKIRAQNFDEVVVGGYAKPINKTASFKALLVGQYQNNDLVYAGRIGTGFTETDSEKILEFLNKTKTNTSPFSDLKFSKDTVWVKPLLVCRIKFIEWTESGSARQPVFLGIRSDIDPKDVKKHEEQHENKS